jgi:hypothetical protein
VHCKSNRTTWHRSGACMTPDNRQSVTSTINTTIRALPPWRPSRGLTMLILHTRSKLQQPQRDQGHACRRLLQTVRIYA